MLAGIGALHISSSLSLAFALPLLPTPPSPSPTHSPPLPPQLCAYLRVRGEALCLCLARHLLERWAEEAGYLVSLRCAVVPVAAAMRGGTMNRVEVRGGVGWEWM